MDKIKKVVLILFGSMLSGCVMYSLSTQSLVDQFINAYEVKRTNLIVAFPFFVPYKTYGNNIENVKCIDENNK